MSSGVITSEPTPDWRGDTLIVAAASGATVLSVRDATDFDGGFSEARYLVAGDETTPREYVAVDKDANTITLATTVGGTGLEVDLPVTLWDTTASAKAVEYEAWVRLHDGSGSVPVVIPHEQVPLSGASGLVGASVELAEDADGDWYVSRIIGREPVVDLTFSATPTFAAVKGNDDNIVSGVWATIAGWFTLNDDRTSLSGALFDEVTVEVDGWYDVRFGATFASSAVGSRALRMQIVGWTGDTLTTRQVKVPSDGTVSLETAQYIPLSAGYKVRFQAWQNSGANLAVRGSNIFTDAPLTDCHIRWMGQL